MKPYCRGCKYFEAIKTITFDESAWCTHPAARKFSRSEGYYIPRLWGIRGDESAPIQKDCDENGWFEPIPERKKFWGLLG